MISLLLLIAAAVPQAKPAHPAAAKPAASKPAAAKKAPAKAPSGPAPTVVRLSPAGQEVLRKYIGKPDADFTALATELRETSQKVQHLGDGDSFDMAALEQLLRKQEELQAAMRKRSDDRLLAMLGEMTPEDRLIFSRAQVATDRPKSAASH